jgi:ferrochelatase
VPWLEPDIGDHLLEMARVGVTGVVVVPIGFVSDHMEVIYDLDTEAAEFADRLGLAYARAATVGVHPAFVSALVDLVTERAAQSRGEKVVPAVTGGLAALPARCPEGCCAPAGRPT